MKKGIILVLLVTFSCFGQNKDDIYLIHVSGSSDSCEYSPYRDGRDRKAMTFKHEFRHGCFVFLSEFFQVVPNVAIREVSKEDIKKLNVVTINYFRE